MNFKSQKTFWISDISWLHPLHLTIIHLFLTIPMVFLIVFNCYLWAGIVFTVGSLCDYLDGALARLKKQKTEIGAFS
jgi:phosphatidylglycerophosphate synthase